MFSWVWGNICIHFRNRPMAMVAVATFMILELKDIDVNQCIDKNEKHFHPHLCVIHSFRLSLECFDADRRSLEGKKLNENSHRSPSFYTHTMSFKDFFRDFWWISNIPSDSHWFFQGFLMNGVLSHHHSTNTRFPMISNDFQRSSWIFRDVRYI